MAFAHSTTYNSVLQCTPFEVGHGLRARTIYDARMAPRMQFSTDGVIPGEGIVVTWEATVPNKLLGLATRLVEVVRQQSEWHRKMASEQLNQPGNPIPRNQTGKTEISEGSKIFFYKPPGQAKVDNSNRTAKHLDYYRGPATVTGLMPGRSRSYEIEYVDSRGTVTTFREMKL